MGSVVVEVCGGSDLLRNSSKGNEGWTSSDLLTGVVTGIELGVLETFTECVVFPEVSTLIYFLGLYPLIRLSRSTRTILVFLRIFFLLLFSSLSSKI